MHSELKLCKGNRKEGRCKRFNSKEMSIHIYFLLSKIIVTSLTVGSGLGWQDLTPRREETQGERKPGLEEHPDFS